MAHSGSASWVVRERASGRVLFETFSSEVVRALNVVRYEAVPIRAYLAGLNRDIAKAVG